MTYSVFSGTLNPTQSINQSETWAMRTARWKYRTQRSHQKSPSGHHCTTISSHLRHISTIGKKNLLSSNISSTCPHNMVNLVNYTLLILGICQGGATILGDLPTFSNWGGQNTGISIYQFIFWTTKIIPIFVTKLEGVECRACSSTRCG